MRTSWIHNGDVVLSFGRKVLWRLADVLDALRIYYAHSENASKNESSTCLEITGFFCAPKRAWTYRLPSIAYALCSQTRRLATNNLVPSFHLPRCLRSPLLISTIEGCCISPKCACRPTYILGQSRNGEPRPFRCLRGTSLGRETARRHHKVSTW